MEFNTDKQKFEEIEEEPEKEKTPLWVKIMLYRVEMYSEKPIEDYYEGL